MYTNLAVLTIFVFVYCVVAGRVERMPVSGPIIFVAFGLLAGPVGFGALQLEITADGLRLLAELALAVTLFTDSARTRRAVLLRSLQVPTRLLLIGLPLTIVVGSIVGRWVLPELGLLEVLILATILAPTDAALGQPVVSNPRVPTDVRETLNVESGMNDGICVPILFALLAMVAQNGSTDDGVELAIHFVVEEIGIGLLSGLAVTGSGWWLVSKCSGRTWISDAWRQVAGVALALSCFSVAQVLGGSGFIACFCGGLLFGAVARKAKRELLHAAEGIGDLLSLATWVTFGATVVGQMAGRLSWRAVVYAVLSLTVVRMAPVLVSLIGAPLSVKDRLFVGWFGPRGLASIVFIVIVVNHQLPGYASLAPVVVCTVVLSILAHGISANPLVAKVATGSSRST